jgi:hypothetical protein
VAGTDDTAAQRARGGSRALRKLADAGVQVNLLPVLVSKGVQGAVLDVVSRDHDEAAAPSAATRLSSTGWPIRAHQLGIARTEAASAALSATQVGSE